MDTELVLTIIGELFQYHTAVGDDLPDLSKGEFSKFDNRLYAVYPFLC